ncbi:hypothetical protein [Pelagibius sp. Alg239-R121]|uniref:hypothetical protein n=1 Tax=Pelagibius sp. Alg239-R121 TaxID=2993448 RepID=UPI0024A73850|nr:hypothetical protein [Pelagibius sp. Alg239-R121]
MASHNAHVIRLTVLVALLLSPRVHADAPPRAPADKSLCAPSGIFCAQMDVDPAETRIVTGHRILWRMPGWYRDAHLADDGEHFVVGYHGRNLLQQDYKPETVMITFWRRDEIIRRVTLSEIIEDESNLKPTVSHFLWGHSVGFDCQGRFVIHTVENRRIAFDAETGVAIEVRQETYPGN